MKHWLSLRRCKSSFRNPTKFNCHWRRTLPNDPSLLDALRKTSDGVTDVVKASLGDFWSSILYHMQVNEKGGSLPNLAVVIYCQFTSTYRFDLAKELIMRLWIESWLKFIL